MAQGGATGAASETSLSAGRGARVAVAVTGFFSTAIIFPFRGALILKLNGPRYFRPSISMATATTFSGSKPNCAAAP